MSIATEAHTIESTIAFGDPVRAAIARTVADMLATAPRRIDAPGWVAAARECWHRLPVEPRLAISRFRRDSGPDGAQLLRGLPVREEDLPDTPTVPESVQRDATQPAALLVMTACGLGEPVAFRAEKHGALVQDVVPVPGAESVQGNSGSVLLTFHTENAFHQHRPDYVLLLCLRADHERVAGLRLASIRRALPLMSPADREVLFRDEFVTVPPPSFGRADSAVSHPVLSGDPDDPDLRIDFAATTPRTGRAEQAMIELGRAFETVARTVRLLPGDLAIVDNRVVVHGRTAFQPNYDGRDRWLQRSFALADLRRSRLYRPDDGNVLAN
jgi:L-asparagine oxygenase